MGASCFVGDTLYAAFGVIGFTRLARGYVRSNVMTTFPITDYLV